jgi:hypothetical protein
MQLGELIAPASISGNRCKVAYTLSGFDPYNVALFEATFAPH